MTGIESSDESDPPKSQQVRLKKVEFQNDRRILFLEFNKITKFTYWIIQSSFKKSRQTNTSLRETVLALVSQHCNLKGIWKSVPVNDLAICNHVG